MCSRRPGRPPMRPKPVRRETAGAVLAADQPKLATGRLDVEPRPSPCTRSGIGLTILVAVILFTMPAGFAIRASILGAVIGFFPIGWIVLNVIFMYRLTVEKGAFETLQQTIGGVTTDRRLQLLLIAFSFGAFFEGASGFGTPVAVTGAILIGLGFSP